MFKFWFCLVLWFRGGSILVLGAAEVASLLCMPGLHDLQFWSVVSEKINSVSHQADQDHFELILQL